MFIIKSQTLSSNKYNFEDLLFFIVFRAHQSNINMVIQKTLFDASLVLRATVSRFLAQRQFTPAIP
jgi:hypothetical protein